MDHQNSGSLQWRASTEPTEVMLLQKLRKWRAEPRFHIVFPGWHEMLRGHSSLCLPASKCPPLKSRSAQMSINTTSFMLSTLSRLFIFWLYWRYKNCSIIILLPWMSRFPYNSLTMHTSSNQLSVNIKMQFSNCKFPTIYTDSLYMYDQHTVVF